MEGGGKTTNDPDPSGRKAQTEINRQNNAASKKPTVLSKKQTELKKKPPFKQVSIAGTIPTGVTTGHAGTDKLAGKIVDFGVKRIAPALGAVGTGAATLGSGVGAGMFLAEAYKKGQDKSGGRVGYMKNPNAKKGGPKHGGAGSGASFIPDPKSAVTRGKHKESIWSKKKSIVKGKK